MKLTIKLKKGPTTEQRSRELNVEVELARDLTFDEQRGLLEAEQTLNSLPANIRVHLSLEASRGK